MRPRDLRSCSCVCVEWNALVSDCRKLVQKKNSLDPYDKIKQKTSFRAIREGSIYTILFAICGLVYEIVTCDCSNSRPFAVCGLVDRIVVCDCNDSRIAVFDKNGQLIHAFGSKGSGIDQFNHPIAVSSIGENLLVSDYQNRRIQIFNSTSWTFIKYISFSEYCPTRVCSTLDGFIVVATVENSVLIIDENGHIVKRFGSYGKGNSEFHVISGICCNSKNQIVVADCYNHRIQVFSRDGVFLLSFGSKGKRPNQFYYPDGICVDQDNNIYVADHCNDRISIFTPEGKPIQQIYFDKVQDLCLVGKSMFVTNHYNCITIFSNE